MEVFADAGQALDHTSNQEAADHVASTAISTYIPNDYLRLLTRIPVPTPAESQQASQQPFDGIINLLLRQPTEIRQLVINWFEVTDLLNLRATNHALQALVHDSECGICVEFSEHISRSYALSHVPLSIDQLSIYFQAERWYRGICEVSEILTSRICQSISLSPHSSKDQTIVDLLPKVHKRVKWKLTRSLILLQHYLNFVFQTLVENEAHLSSLDDDDYIGLFNIFDLDQQNFLTEHMGRLTEADFIDVTASLGVFKAVCKARRLPLNLKTHTFSLVSIKQVLMYNGFVPFAELLAKKTTSRDQVSIIKQLDSQWSRQRSDIGYVQLESIQHLTPRALPGTALDHRRSIKAREAYIDHQDIWDRSARALMMQKLGRFPTIVSPTEWVQGLVDTIDKGRTVFVGSWGAM